MTVAELSRTQAYLLAWPRVNPRATDPIRLRLSRTHLPRVCRELGFTQGAEIGVWKGAYSALFCEQVPQMHLLCVDPWESYPAWLDTKNTLPVAQATAFMARAYEEARQRLKPFRHCTIDRAFSLDAATRVPDRSLDFVYIDANHVADAVRDDLEAWIPKVRPGGIIAGHDFRRFTNKPTIQVIEAVNAFTRRHAIHPWFLTASDKTPSFLWVVS